MGDYETTMDVVVIDGSIVVRGPGRVEGAFTVEAAEASARALMAAVLKARGLDADAWPAAGLGGLRAPLVPFAGSVTETSPPASDDARTCP